MGDSEGNSGNNTGSGVTINIRGSNGSKFAVRARLEATIGEFKTLVAQNCDVPANQQRLIYKGRILKDDQTLESYGVQEEHAVHLVRGFVPDASANSASVGTPAPGGPNSTPAVARAVGSNEMQGYESGLVSSLFPGLDGSALGGSGASGLFGDVPGFDQMQQQLSSNPNMMREMMNMPLMQNLLNDPDIIRNFMMSNPQMREIFDRNPELAHILNDPNTLRQTMETARNPELMREMMRNTDRAMSNIESLPEGFNMLRRMYENVQEPLLNATSAAGNNGNGLGSNPFAALMGNQDGAQVEDRSTTPSTEVSDANSGSAVPNSNPLPNPWSSATGTGATTRPNLAGGLNLPGVGSFGAQGLPGLDSMSGGMPDPSSMIQLLQNPAVSQLMNQMIDMDPQLRGMVDSNPQIREVMQNPERLQQAMASLSSLLGGLDLQSPLGSGQTENAAVPPEERYASQLAQLQEMGFIDTRENIQALLATRGNVHAAVERLLQNLGQ